MERISDRIEDELGLESSNEEKTNDVVPAETNDVEEIVEQDDSYDPEFEEDYASVREDLKNLSQDAIDVANEIKYLAKESESARLIEVYSGLLKSAQDLALNRLEIHGKKQSHIPVEETKNTTNIDKAIFVSSTADLLNQIEEEQEKEVDTDAD